MKCCSLLVVFPIPGNSAAGLWLLSHGSGFPPKQAQERLLEVCMLHYTDTACCVRL